MRKEKLNPIVWTIALITIDAEKKILEKKNDVRSFFILNTKIYPLLWFINTCSHIENREEMFEEDLQDLMESMGNFYA
jgi:hypothetical protein